MASIESIGYITQLRYISEFKLSSFSGLLYRYAYSVPLLPLVTHALLSSDQCLFLGKSCDNEVLDIKAT